MYSIILLLCIRNIDLHTAVNIMHSSYTHTHTHTQHFCGFKDIWALIRKFNAESYWYFIYQIHQYQIRPI